jgi:hypothetical protein
MAPERSPFPASSALALRSPRGGTRFRASTSRPIVQGCGWPVGADLWAARHGPSCRTARPEVGPYRWGHHRPSTGSFSQLQTGQFRREGPASSGPSPEGASRTCQELPVRAAATKRGPPRTIPSHKVARKRDPRTFPAHFRGRAASPFAAVRLSCAWICLHSAPLSHGGQGTARPTRSRRIRMFGLDAVPVEPPPEFRGCTDQGGGRMLAHSPLAKSLSDISRPASPKGRRPTGRRPVGGRDPSSSPRTRPPEKKFHSARAA